jgi:histidine kinase/DNA gyrase B/HSP90-like ATPase
MKSNRLWRRVKSGMAALGIGLRLKPFAIRFDGAVAKAGLGRYYDLLYRSRERVLLANFVSGVLIAFSVYYLGQSTLLDNLIIRLVRMLLWLREFISARRTVAVPPLTFLLAQGLVILLSAGICAYFSSMRKILLLNSCLVLLIILVNLAGRSGGVIPLSSTIVVLLIMAGAAFDYYFERKFQKRLLRDVADKQQTEHAILRHISHSINPTVQMALSPIRGVVGYLGERRLLDDIMARRRDGSSETVGAALGTAMVSLRQIREIIETTESIFGNQVTAGDFEEISLAELFEHEIIPLFPATKFALRVNCGRGTTARLHRPSFVQAIKNIVRNAEVHGFPDDFTSNESPYVRFDVRKTVKEIEIDCSNNGVPFPEGFKTRDFLTFGRKGKSSPGKGLGGAWVKKCVEIHGGTFKKLTNNPVRFRITLPKRRG